MSGGPVKVKICGVTRPEDAAAAAELGADYIGLNLWPGSKRHLTPARARAVAAAVPAGVVKVGVFVNASVAEIEAAVAEVGLDLVQLHGDEPPETCAAFAGRYIRALPADRAEESVRHGDAAALLIDTPTSGHGGSGRTFDWTLVDHARAAGKPIFLAGGLTPQNVAAAVRAVRPFAVDVASGVESSPGIKDLEKMRAFIMAARGASS